MFSSKQFVDRFENLCRKNKVTPRNVMTDVLKKDKSNLVKWKKEESIPKADAIYMAAEYFGVSADYLLGRSESVTNLNKEMLSQTELEIVEALRSTDSLTQDLATKVLQVIIATNNLHRNTKDSEK